MWCCRSGGTSSRRPSSEMTPVGGKEENRREVRGRGRPGYQCPGHEDLTGNCWWKQAEGRGARPTLHPLSCPHTSNPPDLWSPQTFHSRAGTLLGPGARAAALPTSNSRKPPSTWPSIRSPVSATPGGGHGPSASISCLAGGRPYRGGVLSPWPHFWVNPLLGKDAVSKHSMATFQQISSSHSKRTFCLQTIKSLIVAF